MSLSRFPRAKKSFGQNFLHDPGILAKIFEELGSNSVSGWLEIGCGTGVLTSFLSAMDSPLLGVELDQSLFDQLAKFFKREDKKLHQGSILDLAEMEILNVLPGGYGVVGNIPYNLTSPIIDRLLNHYNGWKVAYLMVQKEVGDRILASPGNSNYGRLAVFCQLRSKPTKILRVPAGCFQPPPKVDSVFLRFEALESVLEQEFCEFLFRIVKIGFSQRRKKLKGILARDHADDDILSALEAIGMDEGCRAEEIPPNQWVEFGKVLWDKSRSASYIVS